MVFCLFLIDKNRKKISINNLLLNESVLAERFHQPER